MPLSSKQISSNMLDIALKRIAVLKIAFCETDPRLFVEISGFLEKYCETGAQIKGFYNPSEFIHYVDFHGHELDILLCNIVMGAYNGIKLMHTVQQSLPNIQIIFVSQYKELVFDAYAVRHAAFIPVPISPRHFSTAMKMAASGVQENHKKYSLTLSSKGLLTRIDIADILYMESNLRTLTVHTAQRSLEFNRQLESVKPYLDIRFVHCHKSYLVNLDHVVTLDASAMCFILSSGHTIPISARRLAQTRRDFESYTPA